ncbi:MAG: hypothetical protein LBO70_07730 [Clostridiales Family XIII bacterium]|jgi:hypothetical protein|nr:hypothetical protein [Clostridiales Family XIII bacterium]
MGTDEKRGAIQQPNKPTTFPTFPEDGPEDMEITIERKPAEALNDTRSIFDKDARALSEGLDTKRSAFDKSAIFRTD